MSSDPIEVLRRVRQVWEPRSDVQPAFDAAIAALIVERQKREQAAAAELERQAEPEKSVAAAPAPAPAPATSTPIRGGAARTKPARPTDREIIDVLTLHFRVHDSKVIEWLLEMDLDAASAQLAEAM